MTFDQLLSNVKSSMVDITNRNCDSVDIDTCCNIGPEINFDSLSYERFGLIVVENKSKTEQYTIKCQYVLDKDGDENGDENGDEDGDGDEIQQVKYHYLFAHLNIGPKVFDHFYYKGPLSKFPPVAKSIAMNIINNNTEKVENLDKDVIKCNEFVLRYPHVYAQYIVTKHYDIKCSNFLLFDKFASDKFLLKLQTKTNKTQVVRKMCGLVEIMVSNEIYMSPSYDNFFMNIKDNLVDTGDIDIDVKINITDFIRNKFLKDYSPNKYTTINTSTYNGTIGFTCIDMFCVSLEMLLFIQHATHCESWKLQKCYEWLYPGFTGTKLHHFLKSDNWVENVTKYTMDAFKTGYDVSPETNYKHVINRSIPEYQATSEQKLTIILAKLKVLANYLPAPAPVKTPVPVKTPTPTSTHIKTSTPAKTPAPVHIPTLANVPALVVKPRTPTKSVETAEPVAIVNTNPTVTKTNSILPKLIIASGVGLTGFAIYKVAKLLLTKKSRNTTKYITPPRTKTRSRNR